MPLRQRILTTLAGTVIAGTAIAVAPVASAQPVRDLGPDPSRDPKQGVYVRDSAVAGEKLALAQRMERLKEWNKSADVYQEIVEKYADRVVPVGGVGNDKEGTRRYTSVTLAVQELLGKWPDEGLTEYRARFETPAATMLEAAGDDDAAALSRVVQSYFPTDAAKTAAMRLIELYIESGEFAAAAWTGERLLRHHPGIEVDRPKILFRTALAQHLAGGGADAKAKLDELATKHADATGTFRGVDVNLPQELSKLLAAPAAVAHGGSVDSWPTLGGDATRGRVPPAAGRPGAKLVDIPLLRARQRPVLDPQQPQLRQQRAQADAESRNRRDAGLSLAILPVVDRGELFYQDGGRVYARGLESGLPLPGWATTYNDDARPRYANVPPGGFPAGMVFQPGMFPAAAAQSTVTVTDHSVLAVLGQFDGAQPGSRAEWVAMAGGTGGRDTPLVCLDRTTGARRWSASPAQFPDSLANLRNLTLGGSPLVVGDSVYVAARGGKVMQFEDAYVLCFNLADGKLRWACYLASGNAPDGMNGGGQPAVPTAISHLAFAGGRIYAVSNLGAVAAVDAYAGTIVWLSIYPRPGGPGGAAGMLGGFVVPNPSAAYAGARKPWAQNPAIVREGRLFALPSDAQHMMIYDAATGAEAKRIAMSEFDGADTLLGVVDDKLVVAGLKNVYCIDWRNYAPGKRQADQLFWLNRLVGPDTDDQNRDTIRGRGFVTTDSVFVPTKWALRRIAMKSGAVVESYPKDGEWRAGEGPGNVLVTSDQVIIAGADAISVYSDLALARAKLDRAVESAPSDALPRLKYAEMLYAAGYIDQAVEKLDDAIRLLGGVASMRPGAERDRVFARAIAFAQSSADPKAGASDPVRAAGLYDRAAAAASSPTQQVAYRLARARFARQQRDFPSEVRLLQEILSDASYRAVVVPAEDGSGTVSAARVAEDAIATRVRDYPVAYAPFEAAAKDALAKAQTGKTAEQMLAVAQQYPNAKVAPQAMLAAADAFEAAGKHRPATQVLNQAYRKYRDTADRARIIEAQARNYLALPNGLGVAVGRLKEGAKIEGGLPTLQRPLKLPDGDTTGAISFSAAAERLQQYAAGVASARLPDFHIPANRGSGGGARKPSKPFLPEQPNAIINDVDQLLVPPRELRHAVRHDRVATWSSGRGVAIYAIATNQPLGTCDAVKAAPRGCAWTAAGTGGGAGGATTGPATGPGGDLLVWTADTLFLIRGDNAAVAWSAPIKSLPSPELFEANDDPAAREVAANERGVVVAPGVVVLDNQVVNVRRRINPRQIIVQGGRVMNIGGLGAAVRERPPEGAAERIEHVHPVGDRVVVATSNGRMAAFEQGNGQLAWQIRVGNSPLDQMVASDDFVAARFAGDSGSQIVALETFNGQRVWSRTFGPENALPPLNLALAPDGTLLYMLPDRICGKDLYEPGNELRFGKNPLMGDGNPMFETSGSPDQLVVADGRILAVADRGQFVRQLSLEDGKDVPNTHPLSTTKAPPANNWSFVWLRVVGPRLYVFNARTLTSYNLDRLDETVDARVEPSIPTTLRDAFVGRRHVLLLDQPTQPGAEAALGQPAPVVPGLVAAKPAGPANVAAPRFQLRAYGRYPSGAGRTDESGRIDQRVDVTHPVGIDQWQPVEGGVYYRSTDRKAHFLQGAETDPQP